MPDSEAGKTLAGELRYLRERDEGHTALRVRLDTHIGEVRVEVAQLRETQAAHTALERERERTDPVPLLRKEVSLLRDECLAARGETTSQVVALRLTLARWGGITAAVLAVLSLLGDRVLGGLGI
jgi:hypothetical protein